MFRVKTTNQTGVMMLHDRNNVFRGHLYLSQALPDDSKIPCKIELSNKTGNVRTKQKFDDIQDAFSYIRDFLQEEEN